MQKLFLAIFLPLLLVGCMTQPAVFPTPPVPGQAVAGAPIIGLANVQDTRADNSAGKISALKISAGSDMLSYLEGALKHGLVELGYQVVQAPDPTEVEASQLSALFSNKIILPVLRDANISSSDAILDPADASFDIVLQVYGDAGKKVYAKAYHGEYTEHLGMVASGKKPGKVLAKAADAVVHQALKDSELIGALV